MKLIIYQSLAAVLMMGTVLFTGCEKESKDAAPALPPLTSLSINTQDFAGSGQAKSTPSQSNFYVAVGAISYWNTVISTSLAIPIATYTQALKKGAVRVDNDSWKWSLTVNELYSAELTADVANDSVYLNMYVTKTGSYEHLLWYSGKCNILRTGGTWTIYDIPDHPLTAWLHIVWNADYETKTCDVRYTVVNPSNAYVNSYIEYGITNNTAYNAYYTLYNSTTPDYTYNIEYNTGTHEGYITNGIDFYCWDTNFNNCECAGK